MPPRLATLLVAALAACTAAPPVGGGGDAGGGDGSGGIDAPAGDPDGGGAGPIDGGAPLDARRPVPGDDTHGPADHLLIDKTVHPTQVWNEPFDYRASAYPRSWLIAVVHASMLLRSRCIDFGPDAVMSIALKESKLGCTTPGSLSIPDGCFQIESTSAYTELRQIYGARFTAEHGAAISGEHFETSALAMAHYLVFSSAMLRKYTACPRAFFDQHPDPRTEQKVLCGAYNRGLWWASLTTMFTACATTDVLGCFNHDIAADHASSIVDYAIGFEQAATFDAPLTWDELAAYWQRLRPLYPEVDNAAVQKAMRRAFDDARGGATAISFKSHLRGVLKALIAALPPFPTVAEAAARACTLGYLTGSACQASACADACAAP